MEKNYWIVNWNILKFNDKDTEKCFRIYGTNKTMALLKSKEIALFFIDFTYKYLPHEIKGNRVLLFF